MMSQTSYLSHFPNFTPDPSASARSNFNRLAAQMNWGKKSKTYKLEWGKFAASEFESYYGTEATKLQNWQGLCREVGFDDGSLSSITKCKNALSKVHVNIIDLLDSRRTGKPPKKFKNVAALRKYTQESGRIFPKKAAKRDGFLSALLRVIF